MRGREGGRGAHSTPFPIAPDFFPACLCLLSESVVYLREIVFSLYNTLFSRIFFCFIFLSFILFLVAGTCRRKLRLCCSKSNFWITLIVDEFHFPPSATFDYLIFCNSFYCYSLFLDLLAVFHFHFWLILSFVYRWAMIKPVAILVVLAFRFVRFRFLK